MYLNDTLALGGNNPSRLLQLYFNDPKLNAKQFIVKLSFGKTATSFFGQIIISGIGTIKDIMK